MMKLSSRTLKTMAFLLVAVAAAFAVYEIGQRSIRDIQRVEVEACERVQFLRDQANGTNFLVYDTFKQAAESQRQALRDYKTKAGKESARSALERAQNVVDTTVVTGPTDCFRAVYDDGYEAPSPEFIDKGSAQVLAARASAERIIDAAKADTP